MKSASLPPSLHARLFVNIKRRIGIIYKREVPEFSMTSLVRSKPNLTCMPQESVARVIIRKFLDDIRSRGHKPKNVIVVTGKGTRSAGAPVLQQSVHSFLVEIDGPVITEVPSNPGCFILTKKSIADWLLKC
uniref:Smr domain-containing protein n=1 Tax=Octactis speculum TaxID=3111310 RepID=A0A7S2BL41_9STRA|mmetsp:Transcript_24446/g.33455  ORF Transcript_24446/g.33455 Transcript_24446/m.33455 type:complete len:132 (+) Transcript_24446:155-550(+)